MEAVAAAGERGCGASRRVLTQEAPCMPWRNTPFGSGIIANSPVGFVWAWSGETPAAKKNVSKA